MMDEDLSLERALASLLDKGEHPTTKEVYQEAHKLDPEIWDEKM